MPWKCPRNRFGPSRPRSGCTSIRRPPGSTTASPKLGSCCVGDFLVANSTFTNWPAEETGLRLLLQRRSFRWRSRVLKLKPRLWQNSLRRIPLLTNSATNCCTSARVRRLDADHLFSTVIQLPQNGQVFANRCLGQTLTGRARIAAAQRHDGLRSKDGRWFPLPSQEGRCHQPLGGESLRKRHAGRNGELRRKGNSLHVKANAMPPRVHEKAR
jgi:hypothetical protein